MSTPRIYQTFGDLPLDAYLDVTSWRCGPFLREHFLSLDAIQIAMVFFLGKKFDSNIKTDMIHIGRLGVNVRVPTFSMLRYVIKKQQKPDVRLMLTLSQNGTAHVPGVIERIETNMMSYKSLFENSIITQFIFFFETFYDFMKGKALHFPKDLESRWGFARVVRNALTHGGRINLDDKTLPPVSWRDISYDWNNSGDTIIGNKLDAPDLICLILDLDLALISLGHP